MKIRVLFIDEVDGKRKAVLKQIDDAELPREEVLVDVAFSSLNYKDGLAITGAPIARKLPMVGGIDLAGTVVDGGSSQYRAGDRIIVNGWGMSETQWGGYAERQRVNPNWIVMCPENITLEDSMAIGTAGYTSMLCVLALQDQGVKPDDGPILVTGAAGGVGSVAITLLASYGYHVVASTGRPEHEEYLVSLGATETIERNTLSETGKPFQREKWAGVVDTVGSTTLANAIAQTRYGGAVAACGLAGGSDLPTTVLPFILRGVKLIGVDSVMASKPLRQRAWDTLADKLDLAKLQDVKTVEPMSDLLDLGKKIVAGKTRGRVVINVKQ